MQLQLPEPGADAQLASHTLQQLVAGEIAAAGGWISFERYMDLALYAPQVGYYSGGSAKLGKEGDFTTAPEISPLYGATLAHLAAEVIATSADVDNVLLEFGAGTGKLARDILAELQLREALPRKYFILEISAQLRAQQQETLAAFASVVEWLDALPESFSGVVVGNEVLDAMPVRLAVKAAEGWLERGVACDAQGRLRFEDRAVAGLPVAQIPDADELPQGYLTELAPVAIGFMHTLGRMLARGPGGLAILPDYGFSAAEYYLQDRDQGTLMCHYRHHAHPDPFYWPGLQDITAHVDFTAMAVAAVEEGVEVLAYTSQGAFLLNAGIGELLLRTSPEDSLRYLPLANGMQKLISPAEMGELFKVLAIGKNVEWPARMLRHDRTHRL
ncbi:class I SAM-dependent methyltransferase [Herbaspirillum sp. AP02]|uniref:class I SAM-dependent methyltransferase n=1 Tax=unclassified Herbaspirillum TaxID=2624150 RepID=UPI0015DB190D|nr:MULTISPECIES: class I SAM-dependent methyltransferase [unclassified Herbaspirillum]MBG7620962.1 class I SAM-dependent methyltransferase [Herbaspirillum sp. AP02]NZD68425.1 class I SAM-dependent methyltransferase [Herbaspirillum sp. AP21]